MDSFEAMELGRKLPEQAYTNAVKLRELLTEIVDLRGKIMEWALGAALLATAFLLLALLSGVQLFGGLFNPKTYEAIIRVADFPAACRGSLVGRFGNPRFPNKTCGGASDHTLRLAAGWLIYPYDFCNHFYFTLCVSGLGYRLLPTWEKVKGKI